MLDRRTRRRNGRKNSGPNFSNSTSPRAINKTRDIHMHGRRAFAKFDSPRPCSIFTASQDHLESRPGPTISRVPTWLIRRFVRRDSGLTPLWENGRAIDRSLWRRLMTFPFLTLGAIRRIEPANVYRASVTLKSRKRKRKKKKSGRGERNEVKRGGERWKPGAGGPVSRNSMEGFFSRQL